jgi:hypothetical protein
MASLLKRRCNRRAPLAGRSGEHVGDEKADGLRPLILVGSRGGRSRAPQSRGGRPCRGTD